MAKIRLEIQDDSGDADRGAAEEALHAALQDALGIFEVRLRWRGRWVVSEAWWYRSGLGHLGANEQTDGPAAPARLDARKRVRAALQAKPSS